MQANEYTPTKVTGQRAQQVASWKHFLGFLLICAVIVVLGFVAQHAPAGSGASASHSQLGSHNQAIHVYLAAILMDWILLYYCWAGVHRRGGGLKSLSGGRWTSWRDVAADFAIALPFWVLWEGAAFGVHRLLGASDARSVDNLLPQTVLEILVWIGVSISAGFCEEMAFRGYVQRQLHALTGSTVIAVLVQGLVFGLFHSYQGWKNVIVICVLGILFGALAEWRRNLRTNIIVHAWADLWSGWLKFVVWQ